MNTIKASEIKDIIPAEATHYIDDDGVDRFYIKHTAGYLLIGRNGVKIPCDNIDSYFLREITEIIYDTEFVPVLGMECELAMEETEFLSLQRGEVTTKPAGTRVKVVGHINRIDNNNLCITIMCVDDPSCGFCTGNPEYLVRPIKSEEDKLREAIGRVIEESVGHSLGLVNMTPIVNGLMNSDKLVIKLPEGEQ